MGQIKFSEEHLAGLDLLIAKKNADPRIFGDAVKAVVNHAQDVANVVNAVTAVAAVVGATADTSEAHLDGLPKRSISLEDLLELRKQALANAHISTHK